MKKRTIEEFKKRFKLSDQQWQSFLNEYSENELTVKELADKYEVSYNSLRYLFYSLNFINNSKANRIESVMNLQKELSKEEGQEYNLVEELEKELDVVLKKNKSLTKSLILTRDENNNLRKMGRKEARKENLEEVLLEEFSNKLTTLAFTPIKSYVKSTTNDKVPNEGLVLLLGDSHWGDVSKEDECGNNYNFSIAEQRLSYMVDKTLSNPLQSNTLRVIELLDILKGIIHQSEYLSEGGVTGSMLKVVEVYSEVYTKLSQHYENVIVTITNSNHDRTTQWVSSHMKYDNFGILLYKMIEMVLKTKGIKNVKFDYTMKEHHLININGADIFVSHGDVIRSYKAYSSSERAKAQSICLGMFKKPYKHMISGHLHQSISASNEYGGYNIVNGTLVGNSTYGVSNGFSSIEPVQTILFIDNKGDIEQLSFVNLGHIK